MDKSWINMPRNTPRYIEGVNRFLDFALEHQSIEGKIICPCITCKFKPWLSRNEVYEHLLCNGFPSGYVHWVRHGEKILDETFMNSVMRDSSHDKNAIETMINDAFGFVDEPSASHAPMDEDEVLRNEANLGNKEFDELVRDGNQNLYEGCERYSKLSFLVKLYHIKCLYRISDKGMSMILDLLKDAFEHANIPSFYEAKKIINKLGLNYVKIHACPKNCMLYWGENEKEQSCKKCTKSRWKTVKGIKKPAKVLRYFPLKPRLQRLFSSSKTAESMRWHSMQSNKDDMMRHPRDSEAWKQFDSRYPDFALEPRNVRLGLATDGFSPFASFSNQYSIWPVVLIPYNKPPWECMKQTSFILSMIIPGRRMPGNNIDIYLQPLIQELKELWDEGVDTYDASTKKMFRMRAALMWTINDFPALGNLSGWNVHTGLACPPCNFDFKPHRLNYSKKWCFMGHHRFLDRGHRFRLNRIQFDGKQELRDPPKMLSGSEILKQVENIQEDIPQYWTKKNIFFDLSYWEFNLLRHNLDVMHIEKNVCDNVLYTLLNDPRKSKDNINARKDLKEMGIREDLWPDDRGRCPPAI